MKKMFILQTLILLVTAGCSDKRKDLKTSIYTEKPNDRTRNWLAVTQGKDFLKYTFYGHDKLLNGKIVYYKAEAENLRVVRDSVSFRLSDYNLSLNPFESETAETFKGDNVGKTPYMLNFDQELEGTILRDTMRLIRVSIVADSNFDEIILVKERDSKSAKEKK